ncbi:ArsR/SmtB family transcription factor [Kitasatospora sp. NPDC057015]|uniref:ArsR/SmtB family transcription factor n=1 Tax=Kitasatospora sp. NPDC057015 TaxID=3346001 RepID=UPI00362613F7
MDAVRVVAEPRRREILRLVWDEELSAGEIAERFDVTFGAVSQHLKVLRDAGLVTLRQDGRKRYYRADREAMGPLATYLQTMWATRLDALAELAEQAERAAQGDQAEQAERAAQGDQADRA